jgi:lipopolysaccharide transport system ATP-binding protein
MEYEVQTAGTVLIPTFHVANDEGVSLFVLHDLDPQWRHTPRPIGWYRSSVAVPGNFFAEGTVIVGASIATHDPMMIHAHERDAVAFHVVDSLDGDSARGDFGGAMDGVIRPLLPWRTEYHPVAETTILRNGS